MDLWYDCIRIGNLGYRCFLVILLSRIWCESRLLLWIIILPKSVVVVVCFVSSYTVDRKILASKKLCEKYHISQNKFPLRPITKLSKLAKWRKYIYCDLQYVAINVVWYVRQSIANGDISSNLGFSQSMSNKEWACIASHLSRYHLCPYRRKGWHH